MKPALIGVVVPPPSAWRRLTIYVSNTMAGRYPDFQELLKLFNDHDVRYVIVGSYALAHYGWPRYTKDLDLLIQIAPDNAERVVAARVVAALTAFGFTGSEFSIEKLLDERTLLRLGRPPTQVEILTSIDGVTWDEVYAHREMGAYAGVTVAYIGRAQFIKNKRASGRLQDLADIEAMGEDPGIDVTRKMNRRPEGDDTSSTN